MKLLIVALGSTAFFCTATAKIETRTVSYRDGETTLEGYVALDTAKRGKRPAVLVVHQWGGLTAYEERRARMLAELGYVAFCVDIYGKGVRPTGSARGVQAGKYRGNRPLFRSRLGAALKTVQAMLEVDTRRIAAIGYCFGGTGVLELARMGAEVRGVVSFHGGLDSPTPEDAKNIKAKILVCHGAIDPFVSKSELEGFFAEMNTAKVDYVFQAFAGAVHAFTQPEAGNNVQSGAAFNATADRRSWDAMKSFLGEVLQ